MLAARNPALLAAPFLVGTADMTAPSIPEFPVTTTPTELAYISLNEAVLFVDEKLFEGELREAILVTLRPMPRCISCFKANKFTSRDGKPGVFHEIAFNPVLCRDLTDAQILIRLAHEMCHAWQHVCGKPPNRHYHDKQWADKMVSLGLTPTATGEKGGTPTGEHVDHIVEADGLFQLAAAELLSGGRRILRFDETPDEKTEKTRQLRAKSHTRFACPKCQQIVRGSPSTFVVCGRCKVPLTPSEPKKEQTTLADTDDWQ